MKIIKHVLIFSLCVGSNLISMESLENPEKKNKNHSSIYRKKEIARTELSIPSKPTLIISNDGNYCTHDINHGKTCLMDLQTHKELHQFLGKSDPVFCPNNEYCIISECSDKSGCNSFLYDLHKKTKQRLLNLEITTIANIIVSNNSNHIMIDSREDLFPSTPQYKLFHINHIGLEERDCLKENFHDAKTTAFHPDNEHIFHNKNNDTLNLYNIHTHENKKITTHHHKNVDHIAHLTVTHDTKRIIGTTILNDDTYGHVLFNIEDLNNVTSTTLPQQSCHTKAMLPVRYIPHKQLLTHITDEGCTLQLLDETTKSVAFFHNAPENSYISALAVDRTGNYVAIGHSNGTIVIWHIGDPNPANYKKYGVIYEGIIKALTFGDTQLLLVQSKLGTIHTPTPGGAALLDVYCKKIKGFGKNIANSIMSENGKTIITASVPEKCVFAVTAYRLRKEYIAELRQKQQKLNHPDQLTDGKSSLTNDNQTISGTIDNGGRQNNL